MTEWIMSNKTEVVAIIGSVVTIASIIVKLTPTQKDDAFLARFVLPVLNALALNPKGDKNFNGK